MDKRDDAVSGAARNGGHGIQRMSVETWLKTIEHEEQLERACVAEFCAGIRETLEWDGIEIP